MRPTCINKVFELAKRDSRVAYIGSDLDPPLTKRMREEMPGRAFMEGVSEAHVVGMAAGLAMEGFIPFVHTIATFITRRCYEQVAVVSVCDAEEMKRFMDQTLDWPGPIYIRLAKGFDPIVSRPEHDFAIGRAIVMREAAGI